MDQSFARQSRVEFATLRRKLQAPRLVERAASGAAFKLDPTRLVYSLQWHHRAAPSDFDLVLLPLEHRIGNVSMTLLGELRRRAPHAIDVAVARRYRVDARCL